MNQCRSNRKWIIFFSFFITITLQEMPWPEEYLYYRPTWLGLILIYWVMALPDRVNVGTGFFLGVLMDLIEASTLGIHSLAYSIICYLVSYKHQLFRNMPLWQQSFFIIILSLVMNFTIFLTEFLSSLTSLILFHPEILLNCLINGILWPWMFLLLRKIQRRFLVY